MSERTAIHRATSNAMSEVEQEIADRAARLNVIKGVHSEIQSRKSDPGTTEPLPRAHPYHRHPAPVVRPKEKEAESGKPLLTSRQAEFLDQVKAIGMKDGDPTQVQEISEKTGVTYFTVKSLIHDLRGKGAWPYSGGQRVAGRHKARRASSTQAEKQESDPGRDSNPPTGELPVLNPNSAPRPSPLSAYPSQAIAGVNLIDEELSVIDRIIVQLYRLPTNEYKTRVLRYLIDRFSNQEGESK